MKIIYFVAVVFLLFGCEQDVDLRYGDTDGIYFVYPTNKSTFQNIEIDSVVLSFGMLPKEQMSDTAKLVVSYLGRNSTVERKYCISIVDSLTTMEEGVDFAPLSREQVFRPNVLTDTLHVVVFRKNLNTSHVQKQYKRLGLRMEVSDDFGIGLMERRDIKLCVNNYLAEPIWWSVSGNSPYLDYYHPVKWQVLMYFDSRMSNVEKSGINLLELSNLCKNKAKPYLDKNPMFDEETGERILWNELKPVQ